MVALSFSLDTKAAAELLKNIRGGVQTAAYKAVNATAEIAKNNLGKEMKRAFDRPTDFTLNSMRIVYARRGNLEATVTFKDSRPGKFDSPGHYLLPQVYGGTRKETAGERRLSLSLGNQTYYLVPTRFAPRDSMGNLPRGFMRTVLSQLGALTKKESTNVTVKRRKKAKPKEFFAVYDTQPGLKPGIYRRIGSAFGRAVVPVFIFSKSAPSYRAILRWKEVGDETVARQLPGQFKEEVEQLLGQAGGAG